MMIANLWKTELASHQKWLDKHVRQWRLPSGLDPEDIVAEAILLLCERSGSGVCPIADPRRWLLRAAKLKKLEQIRVANRFRLADVNDSRSAEQTKANTDRGVMEVIGHSDAWRCLEDQHRYVIEQCVMLGRSHADVARELNMKRQTVGGWVQRDLRRLASDPVVQSLKNRRTHA